MVGLAFKSAQKTQSQAHTCHLSASRGMDFPNFFPSLVSIYPLSILKGKNERALVDQHIVSSD